MACWICGNNTAKVTGEHKLKASDLKSEFGLVSQKNPLYYNSKTQRNIPINSIKRSAIIKSTALICENCNTARTSPDDRAWETMSGYLRSGKVKLNRGTLINLHRIFPGETKSKMLNIHLFFLKQFGCAIKELNVPINLSNFSASILLGFK